MKTIILSTVALVAIATVGCEPTKVADNNRDLAYEAYCDSIWEANPDYYHDVLVETDEYCNYIDEHGEWWNKSFRIRPQSYPQEINLNITYTITRTKYIYKYE